MSREIFIYAAGIASAFAALAFVKLFRSWCQSWAAYRSWQEWRRFRDRPTLNVGPEQKPRVIDPYQGIFATSDEVLIGGPTFMTHSGVHPMQAVDRDDV